MPQTKDEEIVITARTRSLGYGWTTRVVSDEHGWTIARPDVRVRGSLRACEREREEALGVTRGGTYWREALFIGGRRIVDPDIAYVLAGLREWGSVTVTVPAQEVQP